MTHAIALQPELRALMMFDTLPTGCVSFLCTDAFSLPHIRPGEFVVVDTTDRTPRDGELYVIGWQSGRRNICEARRCTVTWCDPALEKTGWTVRSVTGIRGRAAFESWIAEAARTSAGPIQTYPGWADGPFLEPHLTEKLVGCVIGIYAPTFEGSTRATGGPS